MRAWMATAVVLAVCAAPCLAEEMSIALGGQTYDVVTQVMGNSDLVQGRLGLGDPNSAASWGLTVIHRPQTEVGERSTMFGLWGELATPLLNMQNVPIPPLWTGLALDGFLDIDVAWDFEADRIVIAPGAGVRVQPTRTMAFIARATYPLSDSSVVLPDINTVNTMLGLEIRF